MTITDFRYSLSTSDKKIRSKHSYWIEQREKDGCKSFKYKINPKEESHFFFEHELCGDSLFFKGTLCPKLTQFLIGSIHGEIIEIFHYDEEDVMDQELYLFSNRSYGLIAVNNWPWGMWSLIEYAGTSTLERYDLYDLTIKAKRKYQSQLKSIN